MTVTGSMCLLRGPDGPLFGVPGPSSVTVRLEWYDKRVRYLVSGSCEIQVANFQDAPHLKVARKLIETQDTLAGFAIGGDGFADGNQAINLALANPTLKPHFAVIRFRRMIRDSGSEVGHLLDLLDLLCQVSGNDPFILTGSEVQRLAELVTAVESHNEGVLGAEKMQLVVRLILGRLSDHAYEVLGGTPSAVAAARSQSRSKTPAAVPVEGPGIQALLRGHPIRLAPPDRQDEDQGPGPSTASKASRFRALGFDSSVAATMERHQFWRLGIKPANLRNLIVLLRDARIPKKLITDAETAMVRAFHRHAPTRAIGQNLKIHAAVVANFLANLAIADFPFEKDFLDAAVSPFDDLSDLEALVALAGKGPSGGRLGQQVISALQSLPNDSKLTFGWQVHDALDSGPYNQEPKEDPDQVRAKVLALQQQLGDFIKSKPTP